MRFEVKMKRSEKMACVTVRDLPTKTLRALKKRAARQLAALRAVAGKWEDDRSAEEIIAEIEGARTPGREVDFDLA